MSAPAPTPVPVPRPGYRALLSTPGARAFSTAGLLGRMPISMLGIGTVLLVQDRRGSYALAGAVSAAYALGAAAVGPLLSGLVDRRGQSRVLPHAVLASSVGLLLLVALAGSDVPGAVLLAPAALAGGALPQTGACVRARWQSALARDGREGRVATGRTPGSRSSTRSSSCSARSWSCWAGRRRPRGRAAARPARWRSRGCWPCRCSAATEPPAHPAEAGSRAGSAMASPGLRMLVFSLVFVGVVFGTIEVGLVAFADERGASSRAGVLLALVAVGSAGAGLAYGARTWRTPLPRRYLLGLLGLTAGVLPLLARAERRHHGAGRAARGHRHQPDPHRVVRARRRARPGGAAHRGLHLAGRRGSASGSRPGRRSPARSRTGRGPGPRSRWPWSGPSSAPSRSRRAAQRRRGAGVTAWRPAGRPGHTVRVDTPGRGRGARLLVRLSARRPGPLGALLLVPVWVVLGLAVAAWIVGIMVLGFLAVLLATLRLLLGPPLRLLARLPGVRAVVERVRLRRYARRGVAAMERELERPARRRTP